MDWQGWLNTLARILDKISKEVVLLTTLVLSFAIMLYIDRFWKPLAPMQAPPGIPRIKIVLHQRRNRRIAWAGYRRKRWRVLQR